MIDFHTHLFPADAASDPSRYATERGELHWLELVAPRNGRSLQGWTSVAEMLRAMDEEGIERAIIQSWYWQNEATMEENNSFIGAVIRRHSDRLWGFAGILPQGEPGAILAQAERWREAGFSGLGELAPSAQGFSLADDGFQALAAWAEKEGLPICLHVNEPVAAPRTGWEPDRLQDFLELAQKFPRLRLQLAHLGGLLPLFAHNPRVAKIIRQTGLYFDTAALPILFSPKILTALPSCLHERILFGSDYPLKMSIRQTTPNWGVTLQYLIDSGMEKDFYPQQLSRNALRFLETMPSTPSTRVS